MKTLKLLAVSALFVSFGAFAKSEIIVSTQKASANRVVAGIDIVSDGKVAAFDFDLVIPGLDAKKADLSSCTAELPKGFRGWCSAVQNKIVVVVVGDGMEDHLPAGLVPVGRVSFTTKGRIARTAAEDLTDAGASEAEGEIRVGRLYVSDDAGKSMSASGKALAE